MKVVISGYYGFDNAGDEAVLAAMVTELRRLRPDLRVVVLSGDPERTAGRHGVTAVPRLSPAAVRRVLEGADLFISGGGTLLQDATGWGSVPYYGGLMGWARRRGVPVFVYAQGIGPLRRPLLRRWAGEALRAATAVTVRDRASAATARELGVDPGRVTVTADPVFALAGDGPEGGPSEAAARLLAAVPDGPVVGVSLRPLPGGRAGTAGGREAAATARVERLAAGLAPRLSRWNARLLPLPLYPAQDGPLLEQLVEAIGPAAVRWPMSVDSAQFSPADWLAVFRRLDLCLTMRLHGLIFAACAAVPFVAWGDDPKLAAHVEELGLPRERFLVERVDGAPSPERLPSGQLAAADGLSAHTRWIEALDTVAGEAAHWRPVIARGAARLAERARETARLALRAARSAGAAAEEAVG